MAVGLFYCKNWQSVSLKNFTNSKRIRSFSSNGFNSVLPLLVGLSLKLNRGAVSFKEEENTVEEVDFLESNVLSLQGILVADDWRSMEHKEKNAVEEQDVLESNVCSSQGILVADDCRPMEHKEKNDVEEPDVLESDVSSSQGILVADDLKSTKHTLEAQRSQLIPSDEAYGVASGASIFLLDHKSGKNETPTLYCEEENVLSSSTSSFKDYDFLISQAFADKEAELKNELKVTKECLVKLNSENEKIIVAKDKRISTLETEKDSIMEAFLSTIKFVKKIDSTISNLESKLQSKKKIILKMRKKLNRASKKTAKVKAKFIDKQKRVSSLKIQSHHGDSIMREPLHSVGHLCNWTNSLEIQVQNELIAIRTNPLYDETPSSSYAPSEEGPKWITCTTNVKGCRLPDKYEISDVEESTLVKQTSLSLNEKSSKEITDHKEPKMSSIFEVGETSKCSSAKSYVKESMLQSVEVNDMEVDKPHFQFAEIIHTPTKEGSSCMAKPKQNELSRSLCNSAMRFDSKGWVNAIPASRKPKLGSGTATLGSSSNLQIRQSSSQRNSGSMYNKCLNRKKIAFGSCSPRFGNSTRTGTRLDANRTVGQKKATCLHAKKDKENDTIAKQNVKPKSLKMPVIKVSESIKRAIQVRKQIYNKQ